MWIFYSLDDYDDFCKVGIDTGGATYRNIVGEVTGLWYAAGNSSNGYPVNTVVFHAEVSFPQEAVTLAGAPPLAYVTTVVPVSGGGPVEVTVQVFNKTATRLPESMFVRFAPGAVTAASMEKLGEWVDPVDVVIGGAQRHHSVSAGGVSVSVGNATVAISSVDARTVNWGAETGFPTPTDTPADVTQGVSFMVWNNIWCAHSRPRCCCRWPRSRVWPCRNTNYPLWIEGDFKFRFQLALS